MEEENKAVNKEEQQAADQQQKTSQTGEDLAAQLEEAKKQAEYYKDLFLRKAAEFDNYKKRQENEASLVIKFANEELISEILPVLDDFERSLKLSKDRKDLETFHRGIELIYQKLVKILESQGIKPIETVGKPFDVHYHDALMQIPREDLASFTILEEVEKGYTFHDKVIRHAKVIVSSAPAGENAAEPRNGETAEPQARTENSNNSEG
ncbi:MAG TPA: nucleotide exchange factor GrpE [Bacteroidota bacterium]|nr:nucleotide exchange factor GrpE [Bacteroidota bacterium]